MMGPDCDKIWFYKKKIFFFYEQQTNESDLQTQWYFLKSENVPLFEDISFEGWNLEIYQEISLSSILLQLCLTVSAFFISELD